MYLYFVLLSCFKLYLVLFGWHFLMYPLHLELEYLFSHFNYQIKLPKNKKEKTLEFNFYDINYLFGVFHLNKNKNFKNFVTFSLAPPTKSF